MVSIKIHDIKTFENFLNVAGRFVQQGQLIVNKTNSSLYCKNTKDFSTSRLLLDTNSITIDSNDPVTEIKICLRDIQALRSSINIITVVEQKNSVTLEIDVDDNDGEYFAKSIQYTGKTKFKLITVDLHIVEQYISTDLTTDIIPSWTFYIDPARLDIIQNKTNTIVNTQDDVSVYFYPDNNGKVITALTARKSSYVNSIALPIAEESTGGLTNGMEEVAIHDSSFRIMNILKVTDDHGLLCNFSSKYNIFLIESENMSEKYYIKSRLLIGTIKGK